jgi:twitching motility two-component system response regulator PilG
MQETKLIGAQVSDREDSSGYIHGFTVISFVQLIELEQKTCTIIVRSNDKKGAIYIENGVVLNAETDKLYGEQAACEILAWEDTRIKLENVCKQKHKVIRSSLTRLIFEASKRKDELDFAQGNKKELRQAIRQIEGRHFKAAHNRLIAYLKKNPKSSEAWFWYSRCLGNLDAISAALTKCFQLAPENQVIAREILKIKKSRKHIKDKRIRRCPFCWSPLSRNAVWCHYCKASLVISKAISPNTLEQVNSEILVEAVTRYTNVATRENNVTAVYFLSLANCNLNKMEEALDLLNEAVRTNPDNEFLAEQLNILIVHVATRLNRYEDVTSKHKRNFLKGTFAEDAFKKKILVVDDSPTTRKVVVLTLRQKGYKIMEARDGLDALSKIDAERPDLILLDIILPKMDGYKILSIIKNNKELRQIPVVMLTSKDGIINKVKGKLAGSTAYLTKPFDPKELIETIKKYI